MSGRTEKEREESATESHYRYYFDGVFFYFPIEVRCCRFTAKILRLFLCAPFKVFRLRMTKYGVTQIVAVLFVRFAAGDKPPPYNKRSTQDDRVWCDISCSRVVRAFCGRGNPSPTEKRGKNVVFFLPQPCRAVACCRRYEQ